MPTARILSVASIVADGFYYYYRAVGLIDSKCVVLFESEWVLRLRPLELDFADFSPQTNNQSPPSNLREWR